VLSPNEIAKDFISEAFPTEEKCLMGAVHILAADFGKNPGVRRAFRTLMEHKRNEDRNTNDCKISTVPLPAARDITSDRNPFWKVKALDRKPASKFKEDEYLYSLQAKQEKLITMEADYDPKLIESLMSEFMALFCPPDDTTDEAKAWNTWRGHVIKTLLDKYLLPAHKAETLGNLETDGKAYVARKAVLNLRGRIRVDAYRPPEAQIIIEEYPDMNIIMGVCHSQDQEIPSALVVIDEHQEIKDTLQLGHSRRVDSYKQGLEDFVKKHLPHVIAVGTTGIGAMDLFEDLRTVADKLKEQGQTPEGVTTMRVVFVADEIPQIYGASPRAKQELATQSRLVCQAVGLARYLCDPLQEIAAISSNMDELLSIRLHPQQAKIDTYDLVQLLHREIIDTVNAVGLDVNSVIHHRFRSDQLKFVAGLGPRKGEHLRSQIIKKGGGSLRKREELISMELLGASVFQNCAGFLMLHDHARERDERTLGETRIHPENYELAVKMAKNALDDDEDYDDDDEELCIDEVMKAENKGKLDQLDLEAYAESLFSSEGQDKRATLYAIKEELQDPGRKPEWIQYKEINKELIFEALTGENEESLRPGTLVMVSVQRVLPRGVIIRHDSGLRGYISIERFSDQYEQGMKPEDFPLTEKIAQNQAISARVVEVNIGHLFPPKVNPETGQMARRGFPLQLTCRTSDLQDPAADRSRPPQYAREADYEKTKAKKVPKKGSRQVAMRSIDHPLWDNVSGIEAAKKLEDKEPGEVIVRPGSHRNELRITWKFAEKVFVHINVSESGRDAASTIGNQLKIGDQSYSDLDEIVAMYIEPRVEFAKEMMSHRKFQDMTEKEAKEFAIAEKDKDAKTIPYMLSASHEYPGRFVLTYSTRQKYAKWEYIMIMQDGFKFRSKIFERTEDLLQWFKQHYKDVLGTPARGSSSARGSSAGRGSSGRSGSKPSSRPLPSGSRSSSHKRHHK